MMMWRWQRLLFAAAALLGASASLAQSYPDRPIRLIVPFGPGGVTDITARTVSPFISELLRGTLVIENRAGGATIIGTEAVAKAKPDGYTLLLTSGGALAANPVLYKKLPFDTLNELTGVSQVSALPYVLVVNPTSELASVADVVRLAKDKPRAISYASAGSGSGNHLTAELFANAAGVELLHVPYKSGGAMVTDLMAGNVVLAFSGLPAALSHIKSAKLKALGVTGERRNSELPDIPTMREAGLPGFVSNEWTAIFAPAGTPREIVTRVNAAVSNALRTPEAIAKLKAIGADATTGSPAELDALLRDDLARWTKLAQTVKFEVQ